MEDEPISMDQNPGRWLVATLGIILCGAGIPALLNPQANPLSINGAVVVLGLALLLLAAFWKKIHVDRSVFAARLNRIASHPGLWIVIATLFWFSTIVINVLKEIRENNEILAVRNDVQAISKVLERGVLPRHLNKLQQRSISSFLAQFEPHEYSFRIVANSEEASSYRADIEQALIKGGWNRVATNPYNYAVDVPEGLSASFVQTSEHSQKSGDLKNPSPLLLLQQALGLAGVRFNSSGGGSGSSITQDLLTISIGLPRKDSYEYASPDNIFQ